MIIVGSILLYSDSKFFYISSSKFIFSSTYIPNKCFNSFTFSRSDLLFYFTIDFIVSTTFDWTLILLLTGVVGRELFKEVEWKLDWWYFSYVFVGLMHSCGVCLPVSPPIVDILGCIWQVWLNCNCLLWVC